MTSEVILGILQMAMKYGIPAVTEIVKEWNSDKEITIEDVRNMEKRFKDPREYFEKE